MPSDTTRNTLVRQWELLKLIPSRGAGKSAKELTESLNNEGFVVTKRQVTRDLNQLQESFALDCNDKSIPYGWRWVDGASIDLPGLSLADSLSIVMIEETVRPLLPNSVVKAIEPRLQQARQKLNNHRNTALAKWADKARTISPSIPLIAPTIDQDTLDNVQTALLREKQLEVEYTSMGSTESKQLQLNPLALVQRGSITYLIATAYKYDDIRIYAVHRMSHTVITDDKANNIINFNIDNYIKSGYMEFGSGKEIKLECTVNKWLKQILEETALSEDQTITTDGELFTIKATQIDSWQLRWWIMSQGNNIKIIKPISLRNTIKKTLTEALEQY